MGTKKATVSEVSYIFKLFLWIDVIFTVPFVMFVLFLFLDLEWPNIKVKFRV